MSVPSHHGFRGGRLAKLAVASAMAFAAASALVGWSPGRSAPRAGLHADVPQRLERCEGGDAVSRFVCRNTWMARHRYGHR